MTIAHQRDIQKERLFYIEFLALFTGQVSRKDLVARFGISEPAATKDLSLYAEFAPDVLRYDLRQKCYVLNYDRPVFTHEVDQALYALAGERAIALNVEHARRLPSWVSGSIKRAMPLSLVSAITRCMYQRRRMAAEYGSMSSGTRVRELTPLALVNDGLRWHIRCFDHEAEEFRDYNLARFKTVTEGELSDASLENDHIWNSEVQLKLVPHPAAEHPETVRLDYDITGDAKYVTIKTCLAGYFLKHWHIDCSENASGNPKAQHLFLENRGELLKGGVAPWALEP
ncbi:WYL domain-containing protein [Ralstonia solanacearum]|uniref:WYL domain-containing protein n=1 Tax=Ralstonia solanacearum TaxID=305 RepID=A0AAE3T429_RALSL|nr:WYL domain-containing protein [Ralstonia solanacearum]MBB6582220.1 WYL domain-containing protein [Ralstonia solanacearum]MDB0522699.1 WYL domain-containing protein [Ralstonia solanacearum]